MAVETFNRHNLKKIINAFSNANSLYFLLQISLPVLSLQGWSAKSKESRPRRSQIQFEIVMFNFVSINCRNAVHCTERDRETGLNIHIYYSFSITKLQKPKENYSKIKILYK